jgi:hypothetical protein
MTVAALIAAGADCETLKANLDTLKLPGFEVSITDTAVNGISAKDFSVIVDQDQHHPHRDLETIRRIIDSSGISPRAKEISRSIFLCLGEAEARIHGRPVERVTFHEVGAVDSIVDIVATAVCVDQLKVERIGASKIPLGHGLTRSAHGIIPIPAPATIDILKGIPVYDAGIESELVTPTGAAILKALCSSFGPLPPMRIQAIGYGAGKKRFERPNLLRAVIGMEEEKAALEKLTVLETNIDDMNPEIYSYLLPLLIEQGALDAFLTNIIMKKGRPAVKLSVLCRPGEESELEEVIFRETTTLGVRRYTVNRRFLGRRTREIESEFGPVTVKLVYEGDHLVRAVPEYEECRRIAVENNLPLREVYEKLQATLMHGFSDIAAD